MSDRGQQRDDVVDILRSLHHELELVLFEAIEDAGSKVSLNIAFDFDQPITERLLGRFFRSCEFLMAAMGWGAQHPPPLLARSPLRQ